jgi:hypothetical protein
MKGGELNLFLSVINLNSKTLSSSCNSLLKALMSMFKSFRKILVVVVVVVGLNKFFFLGLFKDLFHFIFFGWISKKPK